MLRLADGAVGPVQPQHLHQVVGEFPLGLHRVVPPQEGIVGLLLLPDGADQGDDALPQGGEEPVSEEPETPEPAKTEEPTVIIPKAPNTAIAR